VNSGVGLGVGILRFLLTSSWSAATPHLLPLNTWELTSELIHNVESNHDETPEMSRSGLQEVHSDTAAHLGGNINVGDPFTYSPSAWDYLLSRFCIQSVLDLGCGIGNASYYFSKKGADVLAVDGLPENVQKSVFPSICLDLTQQYVNTRVDLVHCQEVVEHVEERFVANIIRSFQSGKYVCMTHALPGQGGHHHVNEQPTEYWVNLMMQNGFSLLHEDTKRVRILAGQDGAVYLHQSGLVFYNTLR